MRRASLLLALLAACGGSSTTDAGLDAPPTDAPGTDAPATDMPRTDASCTDADGDGHGAISCGGDDCDDADPHRYPGNAELCDSIDQDCDPATLGPDSDGDGQPATTCCNPRAGTTPICGTDCDDTRATVNATAVETCNGVDDNCDGRIDEGVPMMTCFDDSDSDSYAPSGAASHMACACTSTQTSRAPVGSAVDCNDANAGVHPGATDICDGLDNDCNGAIDDGAGAAYYADCDVDGYGNLAVTHTGCSTPTVATPCAGGVWVVMPTDCDDTRASVHPGGMELCNGLDDNCNGMVDDVAPATVASDPSHCGSCAHACRHGTCAAATCEGDYVQVTVGAAFACARTAGGRLDCWGDGRNGELGLGSAMPSVQATPVPVPGMTDIVDVAADAYGHTACAVHATGTVDCWGRWWGYTAMALVVVPSPTTVPGVTAATRIVVDGGNDGWALTGPALTHIAFNSSAFVVAGTTALTEAAVEIAEMRPCALLGSGTVSCPDVGLSIPSVTSIGVYGTTTYLWYVTASGHLMEESWFAGTYDLGISDAVRVGRSGTLLTRAGGVVYDQTTGATAVTSDAVGVPAGTGAFGCSVLQTDALVCWGTNDHGQLGDGTTTGSPTPVTVSGS